MRARLMMPGTASMPLNGSCSAAENEAGEDISDCAVVGSGSVNDSSRDIMVCSERTRVFLGDSIGRA